MHKLCLFIIACSLMGCSTIDYRKKINQEGPLVKIPSTIGTVVGAPTALTIAPNIILSATEKKAANPQWDFSTPIRFFVLPPIFVGNVVGTPFYLIKKPFSNSKE